MSRKITTLAVLIIAATFGLPGRVVLANGRRKHSGDEPCTGARLLPPQDLAELWHPAAARVVLLLSDRVNDSSICRGVESLFRHKRGNRPRSRMSPDRTLSGRGDRRGGKSSRRAASLSAPVRLAVLSRKLRPLFCRG